MRIADCRLRILLLITLFLIINVVVSAQSKQRRCIETSQIVNSKAVELPEPVYPDEAISAHAFGKVKVKVIIEPNGKVTDAKAVSGNELLHQAAVDAALKAKFSPILMTGIPPCVEAFLVYSFKFSKEQSNNKNKVNDAKNLFIIYIDENGRVKLNEEEIGLVSDLTALKNRLKEKIKAGANNYALLTRVYILYESFLKHVELSRLIVALRESSVETIHLITKEELEKLLSFSTQELDAFENENKIPTFPQNLIYFRAGIINAWGNPLKEPRYSCATKKEKIEGLVKVEVLITTYDGRVVGVNSIEGHPILLDSAKIAVYNSKFKGPDISGPPLPFMKGYIVYRFSIEYKCKN